MNGRPSVIVVGLSGPDGAGKSSLAEHTAVAAAARGVPVHTAYLYGCLLCRNRHVTGLLPRVLSSPGVVSLERPAEPRVHRRSTLRTLHSALDTAELAVRLRLACRRARRTARLAGVHVVLVVTDRTPLDALVKHQPPERGRTARRLRTLADAYLALRLLDADSEVLSARDREHAPAGLERARDGYRRWSTWLADVKTICTHERSSEELARELLDDVLNHDSATTPPVRSTGESAGARPATRPLPDVSILRAFLLTSHPVYARDGADTEIAIGLAQGLSRVGFTYFGRLGREPMAPGRVVPLATRTGLPGVVEGAQVAAWTPVLTRSADLVHAVMTVGPRYASWSRSRFAPRGRPTVVTVPGVVSPEFLEGSRPLGVTVALSEATAALLRRSGYPDVRVIPPGIDLTRWPYQHPRPKPRPVLFFAGHTDPHGGVREAIDVAARVQHAGIPVRLVMGLRVRPGQSEVKELRLAEYTADCAGLDDVEVRGHIEDMHQALGDADVVMYTPERMEGGKSDIPLVLLEAVATGRPAVVTRLPQMAALGGIVEQVPVGAVDEAALVIQWLLSVPALREERARAGRAAVERSFSTDRMCERYARLYEELLTRGARGARDN